MKHVDTTNQLTHYDSEMPLMGALGVLRTIEPWQCFLVPIPRPFDPTQYLDGIAEVLLSPVGLVYGALGIMSAQTLYSEFIAMTSRVNAMELQLAQELSQYIPAPPSERCSEALQTHLCDIMANVDDHSRAYGKAQCDTVDALEGRPNSAA